MLTHPFSSTGAFYKAGPFLDLCLEGVDMPGRPAALVGTKLPDRVRLKLQRFVTGIKVMQLYGSASQMQTARVVKRLSREGANELSFTGNDGREITVATYFKAILQRPLRFPDIICAEVCLFTASVLLHMTDVVLAVGLWGTHSSRAL